jgi:TM2 domain-containing membrane protein YozV
MEEKTPVPQTPQKPQKSPGFAGFLGIFPFGLGALYNGQFTKFLLYLILFAGLIDAMGRPGSGVVIPFLFVGFVFFQLFDNIQSAKAINAATLQKAESGAVPLIPDTASSGSIFWGAFLIALGILLVLGNFRIILFYENLRHIWPIAVIVIGLKLVADALTKKNNGN